MSGAVSQVEVAHQDAPGRTPNGLFLLRGFDYVAVPDLKMQTWARKIAEPTDKRKRAMLYLDFRFEDLNGQLIVIGWSEMPGAMPQLSVQGVYDREPVFVDRYCRADLGSGAPLAFVAIFAPSGSGVPGAVPEMALQLAGQSCPLPDRGFLALAQTGVKEAFDRVLLLVASGRVTLTADAAGTAVVRRRMAEYPVGKLEAPGFALAVDSGVVSADGAGMLYGWFMADRRTATCKLYGLKVCDNVMAGLRIFADQIERPDLGGFKGRYDFTGRDGFVACSVKTGAHGVAGETQLILAIDLGPVTQIIVAPAQPGGADLVGQTLAAMHHALKRADHRRDLIAGVLGQIAVGDLEPSAAVFGPVGAGGTVVIADVDVHGDFVGDLCLAIYREDLSVGRIVLLVDRNDSAAFQAIDRTLAELADFPTELQISYVERGTLGQCLTSLLAEGFTRLVFSRASVLFHLLDRDADLLAWAAAAPTAQILVFSPLAERIGAVAAQHSAGYQPVVVSAPLAALHDALGRVPCVFMTEEAMLKYITARLPGCFQRRLAPEEGLLLGQDGAHNALLVSGQNAYTVDSLILSMICSVGKQP